MTTIVKLFQDTIQIIILWMHHNPNAALLITFLISFAEAIAILGIIIPGSVTMTFIGLLVGSGVMRFDLTILTIILGTIIGNGATYTVGCKFSERIVHSWPFNRYPHWICYGKNHFIKHGGKSILVGQFLGPARSMIPLIAGIMHMHPRHFYTMTIISAVLWSIVYLSPGALIGAASSKLDPTVTISIFIMILIVLATIWLASILLKWLFIRERHSITYHSIIVLIILLCVITILFFN